MVPPDRGSAFDRGSVSLTCRMLISARRDAFDFGVAGKSGGVREEILRMAETGLSAARAAVTALPHLLPVPLYQF